ncbi:hypothetical protein CesoFtcFv8_011384 [Champsocephalus esox]|uniref:Uncharacterized protein n=1 Tax=Champsocephalus esox TaxID=159716 RepID=A0AAN8BZZ4_9TELE|nr:hypothetical protein CesoFtcFv8_011384 [Champsocephalus esox]
MADPLAHAQNRSGRVTDRVVTVGTQTRPTCVFASATGAVEDPPGAACQRSHKKHEALPSLRYRSESLIGPIQWLRDIRVLLPRRNY